jgi:hypothetical protein
MNQKPIVRRIKVPKYVSLIDHRRLRSHWIWFWKYFHKKEPKKIVIDIPDDLV